MYVQHILCVAAIVARADAHKSSVTFCHTRNTELYELVAFVSIIPLGQRGEKPKRIDTVDVSKFIYETTIVCCTNKHYLDYRALLFEL